MTGLPGNDQSILTDGGYDLMGNWKLTATGQVLATDSGIGPAYSTLPARRTIVGRQVGNYTGKAGYDGGQYAEIGNPSRPPG